MMSVAIASENDSLPESKVAVENGDKANIGSAFRFPSESGHSSLMSRERFGQQSRITFGYASGGANAGSIMSYVHSIDYVLGPTFRAQAEIEVAKTSSNGISQSSIVPSIRFDWRPMENMRLKLNLRFSPQGWAGDGLSIDPRHRPINN